MNRRVILAVALAAMAAAGWWWHAPQPVADRVAGLRRSRFRESRTDASRASSPLFIVDARRSKSIEARRCSTKTIPRPRRRATRPRGSSGRPKRKLANLQPPASPPRSSRRKPTSRTRRRHVTSFGPISQRNERLLKSGAASVQLVGAAAGRSAIRDRQNAGVRSRAGAIACPLGRESRNQGPAGGGRSCARGRWPWRNGGSTSAMSRRRRPALSRTCWPAQAKRCRPAGRWSRCCRPRTFLCGFSCPSQRSPTIHYGDQVTLVCDSCPPDLTGDDLVYLAAGRIHAAGHLQRIEPRQARLHGRGAAAAATRRA